MGSKKKTFLTKIQFFYAENIKMDRIDLFKKTRVTSSTIYFVTKLNSKHRIASSNSKILQVPL